MLRLVVISYLLSCASCGYCFHINVHSNQTCEENESSEKYDNIKVVVDKNADVSFVSLKYKVDTNYNKEDIRGEFYASTSVRNTFTTIDELDKICEQFKLSLSAVKHCENGEKCIQALANITTSVNAADVQAILEKHFANNKLKVNSGVDKPKCEFFKDVKICRVNDSDTNEAINERRSDLRDSEKNFNRFPFPFFHNDRHRRHCDYVRNHDGGNYKLVSVYWDSCEFYSRETALCFKLMIEEAFFNAFNKRIKCFLDGMNVILSTKNDSINGDEFAEVIRKLIVSLTEDKQLFESTKAQVEKRLRKHWLNNISIDYEQLITMLKGVFDQDPNRIVIEPNRNNRNVFIH